MNENILSQVRQIASDIFNVPFDKVAKESSPKTIVNWDSMQQLNLVVALEQAFDVNFGPEEIEKMADIETVVLLVQNKIEDIP